MSEQETKPRRPPCERCGRRVPLYQGGKHCTTCFKYMNPDAKLPEEVSAERYFRETEGRGQPEAGVKAREGIKTVFGYIRVSTRDQAESGAGLAAQRDQIEEFFERKYKPQGYAWGGIYEDKAVSAYKKWFADRPLAQKLMRQLDRATWWSSPASTVRSAGRATCSRWPRSGRRRGSGSTSSNSGWTSPPRSASSSRPSWRRPPSGRSTT
jgi:hypothetical protein